MSFFVAARMHSGQRRRPAKLIAQTAHRKRPHSSQTASAWFSGWWKHVACSATRTAFGTALWGRALSAGNPTNSKWTLQLHPATPLNRKRALELAAGAAFGIVPCQRIQQAPAAWTGQLGANGHFSLITRVSQ